MSAISQTAIPQKAKPVLPAHLANPITHSIWSATSKQVGVVSVNGTNVRHPVARSASTLPVQPLPSSTQPNQPPSLPPACGFVLDGEIDVFGLSTLKGMLRSWHGPAPPGIGPTSASSPAIFQTVTAQQQIQITDIFPPVLDTPLKDLQLANVVITFQSHTFDPTKSIGWHIDADIVLSKDHGSIYPILTRALKFKDDALSFYIHIGLGMGYSWNSLPDVTSLILQGTLNLPDPSGVTLTDGLILTQIGIQLIVMKTDTSMVYEFAVFGEMSLTIPGSKLPLYLDYSISEMQGMGILTANITDGAWKNAFGLGIDLESVSLTATFAFDAPLKSLDISLEAYLSAGKASATFQGSYSSGGDWSLEAHVDDFDVDAVSDFFEHITGDTLQSPSKTVIIIGSADIEVSKSAADDRASLTITLDNVEFDKYKASEVELQVSSSGILLTGTIPEIVFKDITLKQASMQVSFEKKDASRSSDVALAGIIEFDPCPGLKFSAAVHLYSGDDDTLEWTIYGSFANAAKVSLADIVQELRNTAFGGLAIENVLFVVASQDDPEISSMNPEKYEIREGIQVCAAVEEVPGFRQLLRRKSPAMTLYAGWSKPAANPASSDHPGGFVLGILFPMPISIHLGRGIMTDPISLQLQTNAPFSLDISGGIKVPVAKSPEPLDFQMTLGIIGGVADELPTVDFSASMDGFWVDPFGIGDQVKVGQELLMNLSIVLPQFFITGLPTSFGFKGGIDIGETILHAAIDISENPEQELIVGSIENMSIADAELFIETFTDLKLPPIPNFLVFTEATVYLSSGTALGATVYPAGFSFTADILFCGAHLEASASFLSETLKISGQLDGLQVGPLSVKGHNDTPKASVDLELSSTTQLVKIDGEIDFLGLFKASVLLNLQLMPTPTFDFDFVLQFTPLLTFLVDAKMTGTISNFGDLQHLDFDLAATFEQHILDYIRDQILAQLDKAKKVAEGAISSAEDEVAATEKKFQEDIHSAQQHFDATYATWQAHSKRIHDSSQAVINDYNAKTKTLQADAEAERAKFNLSMKDAEGDLQSANAERAAKIQKAEADVTRAKATWDRDVALTEQSLRNAQVALSQKFGNAEQDIVDARNKVDSLQGDINNLHNTINEYENAHWYEFWKKAAIPGLAIAIAALLGSKDVANVFLAACLAVVEGAEYAAVKGAIPLAEDAVEETGKAGDAAFAAAQATLIAVDKVTALAVAAAEEALEMAQKIGDAALQVAEKALNTFIAAGRAALKMAQSAIDDLVKSAEWLAYQIGSAALALAEHATHTLDIAKAALAAAKAGTVAVIDVGEFVVTAATSLLEITEITLNGSLQGILGEGKPFIGTIRFEIMGKAVEPITLDLDMRSTEDFVVGILKAFSKHPSVKSQA